MRLYDPNTVDYPKGPCTRMVYTLAPKYLYRYYFKANVHLEAAAPFVQAVYLKVRG